MSSQTPRVEEIVRAALEIDADEREAFLDDVCGEDANFRRSVETWLRIHLRSHTQAEPPPPAPSSRTARVERPEASTPRSGAGWWLVAVLLLLLLGATGGGVWLMMHLDMARDIAQMEAVIARKAEADARAAETEAKLALAGEKKPPEVAPLNEKQLAEARGLVSQFVIPSLRRQIDELNKQDKHPEAEPLLRQVVDLLRKYPPADGLDLTIQETLLGRNLLIQEKYAEAEPFLRAALDTLEKQRPDQWPAFDTKSLLGSSLLLQKKYPEAEPLLVAGYEGLKAREETIPPAARPRLTEAGQRVVALYEAWGKKAEALDLEAEGRRMIYLDNNSTTPLLPEALEAMRPFLEGLSGNPSSAHGVGRKARRALEDAREEIASLLGAWPEELVFTSGATESNNLALFGLAGSPPGGVVGSALEHPSVVEPLRELERRGFTFVRSLSPGTPGERAGVRGKPPALEREATHSGETSSPSPPTPLPRSTRGEGSEPLRLVAAQLANHEVGLIQDVAAIARSLPEGAALHCDATQAVGKIVVDFHRLGATTLAFTGHKFHGPRAIGGLLIRRGTALRPQLFGGHQQRGLRPGTEPVALVVGLCVALRAAMRDRAARWAKVVTLRQRLLAAVTQAGGIVNGPLEGGLPHALNVSFPGLRGDLLMMSLDLAGVACSTGSACSSGSLLPSPVLLALGVGPERLTSAIRLSLSPLLSEEEIDQAGERILTTVERLRQGPNLALPTI